MHSIFVKKHFNFFKTNRILEELIIGTRLVLGFLVANQDRPARFWRDRDTRVYIQISGFIIDLSDGWDHKFIWNVYIYI